MRSLPLQSLAAVPASPLPRIRRLAIVGTVLVRDGDRVVAGQPLIRLDDTKARTALAALQGQLWDAEAREARLIAERDGADRPDYPESLTGRRADPAID